MKKKSYLLKLAVYYIVICAIIFFLFHTLGQRWMYAQVFQKQKTILSDYASYIQKQHFEAVTNATSSYHTDDIALQIAKTDEILHTCTWIADAKGNLLLNSQAPHLTPGTVSILQYDSSFFSAYYHKDKMLGSLLSTPMLSVILPISSSFQVKGYIVIHYPMSELRSQSAYYASIGYLYLICLCILILLGFLVYYFISIKPMQKITAKVNAATQGTFQCAPSVKCKNAFGQLDTEICYLIEQLQNLDNYQKHFIANVSHDFRSPLTSIRGYAIAIQDGTIPPEMYDKYLEIITFEVDRLTKLTNDLLSINQFDQVGHILDCTTFNINAIVKKTATTFEGTCVQKHIKLKLSFSQKETYVFADQGKIQQVLYNLIDNAIKFSYKDSEIHIKTWIKKEKVLLSVKDCGIGIPKDGIKKIWDRFYKTDLSRGKDKKGTGLGLSITKEIINAHNESITVTSTEGAGTEFVFTLPLRQS